MATLGNEKSSKKFEKKFYCESCDYTTCRSSQYDRHLITSKHKKSTVGNKKVPKSSNKKCSCDNCEKNFSDRSGLWKHKQKCQPIQIDNKFPNNDINTELLKENNELKKLMIEVVKNGTHNTMNNNNNTNSNNKIFNLQFFLNETCKDAMNIMDFVDSIKLQLADLEHVGSIGYVEGISNIITTNLKALDVTQRPIHCTDTKREVLYVKDDNKWEKENEEKKTVRKAIKHVAHKNFKLIQEFKQKYPDCVESDSKKSDQYNKLIVEAMGGYGDNDIEKEDKIIKKITKEVTIDKISTFGKG